MRETDIDQLIDAHGSAVYAFCRSMARNRADAEDLYQQTFLRALELIDQIDEKQNPKSFLLCVAVGLWKNERRKRSRRARICPPSTEETAAAQAADPFSGADEALYTKELLREVRNVVSRLREDLRIPVVMHYSLQMPVAQIARVLKLPQGTVKSRLYKARSAMKKELEVLGYAQT